MALDGCQPLERFMKKEFEGHGAGSAQKSWAFCPSSRMDGRRQQGAPTPPVSGGYVGYSVSGYVNGYNPTLPAYPPTRAQMQAAARNGPAPPPGKTGLRSESRPRCGTDPRREEIRISRDRDHRIT